MVLQYNTIQALLELVDEDDEEELEMLLLLCNRGKKRKKKWKHKRRNWQQHLRMCGHEEGAFERRYHMSEASFGKLVDLLRPKLAVNRKQSMRSSRGSAPITPELVVAGGLRFLGGTSIVDVSDILGISIPSSRRIVTKFLKAVDEALEINVPMTPGQLKKAADDWNKLSGADEIFYGTVGAIDGWLCCTNKPRRVESPNDYYSGHYQRYGLNVQAVCDSNLRFIYWAVAAPGRTNDQRAFRRCEGLRNWLDYLLPDEYFILGDAAYPLSRKILIPFSGKKKKEQYKSSYNFWLSQQRIRIEMAFGRLTTKFRIFRKNLDCSVEKNSLIIRAAGKLHNFVIDNDNLSFEDQADFENFQVEALDDNGVSDRNRGYIPSLPSETDRVVDSREVNATRRELKRSLQGTCDVRNGISFGTTDTLTATMIPSTSCPWRIEHKSSTNSSVN